MKLPLPHRGILLFLFIAFVSFSSFSQAYLRADGKRIVNEKGEEVILRGMGLGGWMLQEPYMMQLAEVAGTQHEIKAKIKALVGEEKTQQFYEAWLNNYLRKIDVDSLSKWGFNSIRLPIHYNLFTLPIEEEPVAGQNTWLEKGFALTDNLLKWCQARKIYLILDLHAAPGGQGKDAAISDRDDTKPSLWESPANQDKAVALWKKLAERYGNQSYLGGYDLINETNWGFTNPDDPHGCSEQGNQPLKDLLVRMTKAIREVDTKHIIFIEGNCWANNHNGLLPFWDNNMVLSFHKYWSYNDKGSIQGFLDLREKYNVPLWLGESGENSNSWNTGAIKLLETNKIGWAWWTLKKNGLNTPLEVKMNDGFRKIIDYWKGGAQPSEAEAFAGLMQLAENYKMENCFFHKDFIDAMFRQVKTNATKPFKPNVIAPNSVLFAADYDLGKNLFAYSDRDTSNYSISSGTFTAWNNGWAYRNDGVDIETNRDTISNGYSVGWTNDGEWLQYTVNVPKTGAYDIKLRTATNGNGGRVSLSYDGLPITATHKVPNSGSYGNWVSSQLKDVYLTAGTHKLRVNIDTGGFNLNYLQFSAPKALPAVQPKLLSAKNYPNGYSIVLLFDQPIKEATNVNAFNVMVNSSKVGVAKVFINGGNNRIVYVQLNKKLTYGDFAFISYSGGSIVTLAGVKVNSFSNIRVDLDFANPLALNVIPGKIEAENFSTSEGVRTEDCTDAGGGLDVGYNDPGDYYTYNVTVKETGYYSIDYRTAGQDSTGRIKLTVIDKTAISSLETVDLPPTGGWQTWKTVTGSQFYLAQGEKTIKVEVLKGGFNINHFTVNLIKVPDAASLRFISGKTDSDARRIWLYFNKAITSKLYDPTRFNLLIDGKPIAIKSIFSENTQYLALNLDQEIQPGSIIKVAYNETWGPDRFRTDMLKPFDFQLIHNTVVPVIISGIIPGRLEAESFIVNQGFQTENTGDTGGGQNVGYTDAGDYLDYRVKVETAGEYTIGVRYAGYADPGNVTVQLIDNGTVVDLATISLPSTFGWQSWQTATGTVTLPAGRHMLRVIAGTGAFNLNYFEFTASSSNARLNDKEEGEMVSFYPNPNRGSFEVRFKEVTDKPAKVLVKDLRGNTLLNKMVDDNTSVLGITHSLPKGVYLITFELNNKTIVRRLIVD